MQPFGRVAAVGIISHVKELLDKIPSETLQDPAENKWENVAAYAALLGRPVLARDTDFLMILQRITARTFRLHDEPSPDLIDKIRKTSAIDCRPTEGRPGVYRWYWHGHHLDKINLNAQVMKALFCEGVPFVAPPPSPAPPPPPPVVGKPLSEQYAEFETYLKEHSMRADGDEFINVVRRKFREITTRAIATKETTWQHALSHLALLRQAGLSSGAVQCMDAYKIIVSRAFESGDPPDRVRKETGNITRSIGNKESISGGLPQIEFHWKGSVLTSRALIRLVGSTDDQASLARARAEVTGSSNSSSSMGADEPKRGSAAHPAQRGNGAPQPAPGSGRSGGKR